MNKPDIKTDCFGYDKGYYLGTQYERCNALRELYCKNEECKFYKSKEQHYNELRALEVI